MSMMHFGQIDLNLLRVFDALLDERNVTRAGARLGLSQSAVSHSLGRLRLLLDDELFVRRSTGMEPTPRALQMGPALHTALLQVQAALAPSGFDPASTERRFAISAGAYGCAVLVPQLVRMLGERAPGATLQILPYGVDTLETLDAGRCDAALMGDEAPGRRFRFLRLFTETMVWVVRAGHPLAEGELTVERLLEAPHILIAGLDDPFEEGAQVGGRVFKYRRDWDRQHPNELGRRNGGRRIAVRAPDSISALAIASRTDMAALVPERLARGPGFNGRVAVLPAVLPPYSMDLGAVVREDRMTDPAVAWLSGLLAEAAAPL